MANQKHLTALDRITIENGLKNNDSFKAIAKKLDKDCTTISKEVKNNLSVRKTGAFGRSPSITVFTDIHARNVILPVTTVQL